MFILHCLSISRNSYTAHLNKILFFCWTVNALGTHLLLIKPILLKRAMRMKDLWASTLKQLWNTYSHISTWNNFCCTAIIMYKDALAWELIIRQSVTDPLGQVLPNSKIITVSCFSLWDFLPLIAEILNVLDWF